MRSAVNVSPDETPQTQGDGRADVFGRRFDEPDETPQTQGDGERVDALQSARDRRFRKFSWRWRAETRRIAMRKLKAARQRKDALHRWTSMIAARAAALVVIAPPVRENTKSAKGDAKTWGANVRTVAALNRATLEQAPASAVGMLKYKVEEAGAAFLDIEKTDTDLAIGRDLPETTKQIRRTRRKLKESP